MEVDAGDVGYYCMFLFILGGSLMQVKNTHFHHPQSKFSGHNKFGLDHDEKVILMPFTVWDLKVVRTVYRCLSHFKVGPR